MHRLLVANRGEIARRVFRTAHRLGLDTVAVFSDADAGALHVREAGQAVALGGSASADSYLRIDKLLAAARASGADAVHPGYGFLSENAEFAQAVADAGLTWVGPPAEAIRRLGSKSAAKRIALAEGIPCLPGYAGEDQADARFIEEAQRIGFPVMVKAAAGGGGRGMRLVHAAPDLVEALRSARSEAQAAFGSGELLLERALFAPRHVEIQVFADAHGHCIHLGERDCSLQRRHQKLVEETPGPAMTPAMRERMGACAVRLAQAAGYVGAGTVEFLVEGEAFFLMEMNTRLQVEHPVTEMVTGLDLVEWQLRVARGEPLPLAQEALRFHGHAIEVRLCAEDEHFTPHTGTVLRLREPAARPGLRFDHALFEGLQVTPHYDSMLGKLVAHAPTRAQAVARLASALDALDVRGLPTNRRFLAAALRLPGFLEGEAGIDFFARTGEAVRAGLRAEEDAVLAGAAKAVFAPAAPALGCPWPRPLRVRHRGQLLDVPQDAAAVPAADALPVPQPGGGTAWHLRCGTLDFFAEDASFEPAARGGAGAQDALRSPFNGKVIALPVAPGTPVRQGQTLAVLESMKLEHALTAPRDGRVAQVAVAVGQQAAPGQLLVQLEPLA
ncbi:MULTISPECIES: biotin carboxylase N-terminal domain-containing protein [Ramlibacter]|uniref:acetyl/propionyl/methylcrotonyl-CoA carboxylase subunit alpha n=1 Tax=Ramlibacter TaxID=174951 RepID=UPI00257B4BE1|nr:MULTISPECIES: biotin carboxylase N-terminal domain-containing protein [Ramlibacter]